LASDPSVGVVVGLAAEARIAGRLGWLVAVGGGTAAGAKTAARSLADAGVGALVSFGLAGGLDPTLRPGALIVPSAVIAGGSHHPTDPGLSRVLGGATPHAVLDAEAIVASVAAKRCLRDRTSAAAIDLESGAVACIASERGVPFAVLRAICDPAERVLPPAALAALDANGAIGTWRVIASLTARPGQLRALLVLAGDAAAARRSLVARVRQITRARA
jgi:adenosylhomocysteine nucleosidase